MYTLNTNNYNIHSSIGLTSTKGVRTVRLEVVKVDSTTKKIKLSNILYYSNFATNVIL
jgi:hypothetical protein